MASLHAVIMAGGSGTRFWPASRSGRPKQFLPLVSGKSLIESTIDRLDGLIPNENLWVVTNATQAALLREIQPDFPPEQILVEPEPRDTAPCVAFASAAIAARDPEAVMCFLPADHVIEPVELFQDMVRRAAELTADGETLVTFGIPPTYPATGFGYIEPSKALDDAEPQAFEVARFREKPDEATAKEFFDGGEMLWNSGIFVWSYPALRNAMKASSPDLESAMARMCDGFGQGDRGSVDAIFGTTEKTSVDYAVMEKAPRIAVVRAPIEWNDLGSFLALDRVTETDGDGNTTLTQNGAREVLFDTKNSIVYGDGPQTIALLGCEDLVVVRVDDAILVCPKSRTEDIKKLREELKRRGMDELL
ncbi:MAG: sugar phosphate nucleotidyltransferase [Planctomycetota bacterium]